MSRLKQSAKASGASTEPLIASRPTMTTSSSKATALGVSNSPARLGTVVGRPVEST